MTTTNNTEALKQRLLPKNLKLFINGEFVDAVSKKTFPVISPHTEEVLCHVAEADKADVDLAVEAAEAALEGEWKKIGNKGRQELLLKLADLWEKKGQYLSELEVFNNGTPITQQKVCVEGLAHEIRYHAGWCEKAHDGRLVSVDGPFHVYVQREAIGVCGAIIAWNLPLWCFIVKAAPCLAMGNTLVIKPAEQTPLTALAVAELFKEAGFPPGVINIVPGYGPTAGAAISTHMKVRKIAFTGSTDVGRIVMRAAADSNLKQVQLELGGKSPVVIFKDADMDTAVNVAASAIFSNNGEQCDAGSRTFVHESIYDEFVKRIVEKAASLVVGDPLDSKTDLGPMIDKDQYEKVLSYIETGKKEAKLLFGGSRVGTQGYYLQPTIFGEVEDHHTIAREEIFGPVMSILKYKDTAEVIKRANSTSYGLAGAVVSNNVSNIMAVTKNLKSGFLWVNTYFVMFPQAEFGGMKQSGFGKDGGKAAIEEWSVTKTVVMTYEEAL